MKVTLCIPLYNEEKILYETERTVRSYMDATFGGDYEVIFINDGSTDKTGEILDEICRDRIRAISYRPNRGKGQVPFPQYVVVMVRILQGIRHIMDGI